MSIPAEIRRRMKGHSAFRQAVWTACAEIPSGQVRSYGWIARRIGKPKAARAVGQALGANPFAPIIPCHRVVGADGLGGYSARGGQAAKRRLLRREGAMRTTALGLLALLGLSASGCLGYPRPYLRTISGKALLDNGQPLKIGAAIVKDCDSINGETEERGRMRTTTTDKDGRYSLTVIGLAWNYKNFVTLSECTSHVQRFVCRPYCKQADAIDIDILGK